MEIKDLEKELNTIQLNKDNAGNGLVKLVLALINVIRELMEKQALRKIEAGLISDSKIEEMGATFLALDEKINELKNQFDLTDEDLEIDLNNFIHVE
ncbi:MAG: gas vesicle protein K [Bacteroidota bacterium]